jgi:hypothetical protein
MLEITIPAVEVYDELTNEFRTVIHEQTLRLEHSLVSLAKWESKWCKPLLSKTPRTVEETIDYIKCMTITQNVDPRVYDYLNNSHIAKINEYIEAPMTATTFSQEKKSGPNREQITAELVYYWMIALNIPFECQKWHLNRLLTLIKVCSIKNQPPKKMSKSEILNRNAALNEQRKKQLNTKG